LSTFVSEILFDRLFARVVDSSFLDASNLLKGLIERGRCFGLFGRGFFLCLPFADFLASV
jgi:hypothetical protein